MRKMGMTASKCVVITGIIVAVSNFAQAMPPPPLGQSSTCTIFNFDSNSGNITYSDMKYLCGVLKPIKGWNETYWCQGDGNSTTCYTEQFYHEMKDGVDTRGPYACAYNDIGGTYSCWNPHDHSPIASFAAEAPSPSPSPPMPPPIAPPRLLRRLLRLDYSATTAPPIAPSPWVFQGKLARDDPPVFLYLEENFFLKNYLLPLLFEEYLLPTFV